MWSVNFSNNMFFRCCPKMFASLFISTTAAVSMQDNCADDDIQILNLKLKTYDYWELSMVPPT